MIVIDTPGARLEFPPDAPPDAIRQAIAENAPDDASRTAALNQWADQFVKNERVHGGFMQGVGDTVRNLARGTPVGSWLDEANAGTSAALSAVTGGKMGAPYDEAKAYQSATDRAVDKDTGLVGTATQLAGSIASIPAAPVAAAFRGATLLPQMGNAALTGAGYGAVYGAGEGDSLKDRATNAAIGTGIGTGIGVAAPVVARGVSNAAGYVADKFKGVPQELADFRRPSIDRVTRAMNDDAINPSVYNRQASQLGPEGMIADMGPNLTSQAGAIANQPGAGQRTIVGAIDTRKASAADRVKADTDAALGPRVNLIEAEQTIRQRYGAAAKPLYDEFRQTPVPFTQELEQVQNVLKAEPGILRQARKFATLDGTSDPKQFFAQIADNGEVTITRVPNASELDYVKRALDDFARTAGPGTHEQGLYEGLARKVRHAVDSALNPSAPDQSIYAQARGIAGEGIGLRKAMEEGQGAFSKSLHPDQMRADIGKMSKAEQLAYALGARGQVADTMGNSATSFGANGDTAARRALGSDYAREKLGLVAGDTAAEKLIRRLDAETAFERTRQAVTQNSKTASRTQAQQEFPNPTSSSNGWSQNSLAGTLAEWLVRKPFNAMTGGALNERNANIGADAAKLLSATGGDRDAMARALMNYSSSKSMTKQGKESFDRLVQVLLQGSRQPAIEAASRK